MIRYRLVKIILIGVHVVRALWKAAKDEREFNRVLGRL